MSTFHKFALSGEVYHHPSHLPPMGAYMTPAAPESLAFPSVANLIEYGQWVGTDTKGYVVLAKLAGKDTIIKFDAGKGTQYDPPGWKPVSGEKAMIEFTAKPSTFSFDVAYVMTSCKKIQ